MTRVCVQKRKILKTFFTNQYFTTYVAFPSSVEIEIFHKITEKLSLQNSLSYKKNIHIGYNEEITLIKQKGKFKSTITLSVQIKENKN